MVLSSIDQVLVRFVHVLVGFIDVHFGHVQLLSLRHNEALHVLLHFNGVLHLFLHEFDFALLDVDHAFIMKGFLIDLVHLYVGRGYSALAFLLSVGPGFPEVGV